MAPFDHCEQLVREHDKDRFLATLFAPAQTRGALLALYAFDLEVAQIRDRAREPMPGEIRLQWWREVLSGERRGEAAAHPVAAALTETIARFSLPTERLIALTEARAFDLYDDPIETFPTLEAYLRRTTVTIFDLAARVCGAGAEHAAERAGIAYGVTALLRSFALNASRRQLFLPVEFLERGSTPEQIFAGLVSPFVLNALGMLRTRAREHFAGFEAALPHVSVAALPALVPAALVPGYLAQMERRDYDPFHTAIEVPQWRRQWTLWRAARRFRR